MAAPFPQRPAKRQKASRQPEADEAQQLAVLAAVDAVLAGRSADEAVQSAGATRDCQPQLQAEHAALPPQQNGVGMAAADPQTAGSHNSAQPAAPGRAAEPPDSHAVSDVGRQQTATSSEAAATALAAVEAVLSRPRSGQSHAEVPVGAACAAAQQTETAAHQQAAVPSGQAASHRSYPPAGPAVRANAVTGGSTAAEAAVQHADSAPAQATQAAAPPGSPQALPGNAAAPVPSDSSATQVETGSAGDPSETGGISSDAHISDAETPVVRPPLRKVKCAALQHL